MSFKRHSALVVRAVVFSGMAATTAAHARPLTLQEALASAEAQSLVLSAARASVVAAQARARQAGAAPNPELDVEVENVLGSGPYKGLGGTELTAAIAQRFELGGKRGMRRKLAAAEADVAALNLLGARADLLRDVRNAYAELAAAEGRRLLARGAVDRSVALARTARLLVEVGRDPPLRRLRAEAVLVEAQAGEQRALAELTNAQRALAGLAVIPNEDIEAVPLEPNDLQATPANATTRLAVRIAEAERRVAEARIDLEEAQRVPDLTLRAGVRGFAEGRDVALVGGVSLPIPIRNRNTGAIDAARAELLAAEARLMQVRRDTNREERDAQTLLEAADARLAALGGAGLSQAEEAVRLARLGYAAGKFSLLEMLDAETALNAARAALIDAERDRSRAIAALLRARQQ
ncbi:MAG TPA: TolC family protein [Allosphingosinicella sp.]|nr:TolC family protein [Allosphingosinicella sp.]